MRNRAQSFITAHEILHVTFDGQAVGERTTSRLEDLAAVAGSVTAPPIHSKSAQKQGHRHTIIIGAAVAFQYHHHAARVDGAR